MPDGEYRLQMWATNFRFTYFDELDRHNNVAIAELVVGEPGALPLFDVELSSLQPTLAAVYANDKAGFQAAVTHVGDVTLDDLQIIVDLVALRDGRRATSASVSISSIDDFAPGDTQTLNLVFPDELTAGTYDLRATIRLGGRGHGLDAVAANDTLWSLLTVDDGRRPGTDGDLVIADYDTEDFGDFHRLTVTEENVGSDPVSHMFGIGLEVRVATTFREVFFAREMIIESAADSIHAGTRHTLTFDIEDADLGGRLEIGEYELNLWATNFRGTFFTERNRRNNAMSALLPIGEYIPEEPGFGTVSLDLDASVGDQERHLHGPAAVGDIVTVQLYADNAPLSSSWSVDLDYDAGQLRYVFDSFETGDFLPDVESWDSDVAGRLGLGVEPEAGSAPTGQGAGFLGSVQFEILDGFSGSAELLVRGTVFVTPDGGEDRPGDHFTATISAEEPVVPVIVGDFNEDGLLDFADFFLLVTNLGSANAPAFDLDGDGLVDMTDIFLFADSFRQGAARRAIVAAIAELDSGTPPRDALLPSYPNPANPSTTIPYQLAGAADVELLVYNAVGQRVRILVNAAQTAGAYTVVWNGSDDSGRALASGRYFVRLQTGDVRQTHQISLLK